MHVRAIQTEPITPSTDNLLAVLDTAISELKERSIVVISSKIIAISEARVVPIGTVNKDELIKQEAMFYLPRSFSDFGMTFTITRGYLIPTAGIDESNGNGYYVLWPTDPQATANGIRQYLSRRFKVQEVGVIITDSTSRISQRGTTGISLAASGFEQLHNYQGKPDIFGRELHSQTSNIVNGLAAAAVVTMGEGNERTPIAVIDELPFVNFQPRDPTTEELEAARVLPEDDIYAPFLKNLPWKKGEKA